jgi:hypothetical protein
MDLHHHAKGDKVAEDPANQEEENHQKCEKNLENQKCEKNLENQNGKEISVADASRCEGIQPLRRCTACPQ